MHENSIYISDTFTYVKTPFILPDEWYFSYYARFNNGFKAKTTWCVWVGKAKIIEDKSDAVIFLLITNVKKSKTIAASAL